MTGDHRAFVGPPEDYDLMGALQFSLLVAVGMREHHTLLDVGCGSLRGGRFSIAYLAPGRYCGIEPNAWLIEEAVQSEVGRDIIARKQPRFSQRADFSAEEFDTAFDYVMAQSIFSHTYPDEARRGLAGVARALADDGLFLGTVVEGDTVSNGSGWLYPGCTEFPWEQFTRLAGDAGLAMERLAWPHPRQTWFVAGRAPARVSAVAATIRSPRADAMLGRVRRAPAAGVASPGDPDRYGASSVERFDLDDRVSIPSGRWLSVPWSHAGRGEVGTRLTPEGPGPHLVVARVVWQSHDEGNRWIRVVRNGNDNLAQVQRGTLSHGTPEHQVVAVADLEEGDAITVDVHHDMGADLAILSGTQVTVTRL